MPTLDNNTSLRNISAQHIKSALRPFITSPVTPYAIILTAIGSGLFKYYKTRAHHENSSIDDHLQTMQQNFMQKQGLK